MGWQDKSDDCTKKELDEFRREWNALKNSVNRGIGSVVTLMDFEDRWLGYCDECVAPIPSTKKTCPVCSKSRF